MASILMKSLSFPPLIWVIQNLALNTPLQKDPIGQSDSISLALRESLSLLWV